MIRLVEANAKMRHHPVEHAHKRIKRFNRNGLGSLSRNKEEKRSLESTEESSMNARFLAMSK